MDYSTDPVRAQGPPAVTEGTPDWPIVLVLDPAGAAKHDELPVQAGHPDVAAAASTTGTCNSSDGNARLAGPERATRG